MTWILHADFDAFFASVEQARNPTLRGRPVAVGNGVIASCSYEARRRGLFNGMPLSRARRLCPEAVFLDGSHHTYRPIAERIFRFCREISPNVETFLDEAYVELTGTRRLHGPPLRVGRLLRERIRRETGLPVTVGIGRNRMTAKIAGRRVKPDGLGIIRAGEEEEAVAGLPVRDLPGVGYRSGALLDRLRIRTVADLRRLSPEELGRLFGSRGALLHRRARGEDTAAVEEREIPRSVSRETSFHRDTGDRREIEAMLYYLSERAARTVRKMGLEARTVHVRVRRSGGGGEAASFSLDRPTALHPPLYRAALHLLDRVARRREGLHLIGVALSRITLPGPRQTDLYEEGDRLRQEGLSRALDRVRDRFGFAAVTAGRSIDLTERLERDSHGFVLRTPSLTK